MAILNCWIRLLLICLIVSMDWGYSNTFRLIDWLLNPWLLNVALEGFDTCTAFSGLDCGGANSRPGL